MKLDIIVPTSLKDITLKDYQAWDALLKQNIEKDEEGKPIIPQEKYLFLSQKIIQIFCHVPLLAVTKMARKDFNVISAGLWELLKEQPKLTPVTELRGVKYGFIPNMDKDLTLGEFVDLDLFMKDWSDFHKAMAVMYRPVKGEHRGKYTIVDYDTDTVDNDLMKGMPMDVVMGAVLFFWTLSGQLLRITPKFLQQHLQGNPKAKEVLDRSGVGISTFTNSLAEASLTLEGLLNYIWVKPSCSLPMTGTTTKK